MGMVVVDNSVTGIVYLPKVGQGHVAEGTTYVYANVRFFLKGLFGYMLLLHISEVDKQSILDNKW